jgi:protein SCO1/2
VKLHFGKNAIFCVLFLGLSGPVSVRADAVTAEKPAQVELKGDPKKVPQELDGVGVSEHLGERLDLSGIELTDSVDGKPKKLAEFFTSGKPVILNLVYYECPMLCTMVLNGLTDGIKGLQWSVGQEFRMVTVSINPKDSSQMASAKKEVYLEEYFDGAKRNSDVAKAGWHFLTGTEEQIKKLSIQVGFNFKYDAVQKQYAHPAVTFILTPEGVVSRYLYGVTYQPKDLKLALLEASQGKIGNVLDRLLMFCYHYEPSARGYSLQAFRVMQLGAALTTLLLGSYLGIFWTRQRKGKLK